MLAILLLSSLSTYAIAAAVGLVDFGDNSPEEDIEEANLDERVDLIDPANIEDMEAAFANDPLLAQEEYLDEDEQLNIYSDTDWSNNQGTEGDDFMAYPEDHNGDVDPLFGEAGNDVMLGSDQAEVYEVLFGDDGDDTLFGQAGEDWLFGDAGNDTLSGGGEGDLLAGGGGSDLIYGGDGNDNIYDDGYGSADEADDTDVINAGAGDDGILIEDGVNLLTLGAGNDHVTIHTERDDTPGAVITDFNPEEDGLLLGVYSADLELPEGVNAIEMTYTLTAVETPLGTGTLVQASVADEELAAGLGDYSTGYAVLLGVAPEDLDDAAIRVVLESDDTQYWTDEEATERGLTIEFAAEQMGATRL